MTSQASFIAYDMMDRIRANSAADYTVTPPTSGNLNVARDQDLYDFTTNIVNFGGSDRHWQHRPQSAGLHHHHQLG
jgi:type IV pilus assembly protein PilV